MREIWHDKRGGTTSSNIGAGQILRTVHRFRFMGTAYWSYRWLQKVIFLFKWIHIVRWMATEVVHMWKTQYTCLYSIYTCVCYERKGVMYVIKYTNFHVKGVDNNFSLILCLNPNLLGICILPNYLMHAGHHNRMAEIITKQRFKPISPQFLVQCSTKY